MAVIVINGEKQKFMDAYSFTPLLPTKVAELLIIQRAIVATDSGEVVLPADLIDEMRGRFLVYGSRSPMDYKNTISSHLWDVFVEDGAVAITYMP